MLSLNVMIKEKKFDYKTFSVCDIDPADIAKHLTAVEWKLFKRIKPKELLRKGSIITSELP